MGGTKRALLIVFGVAVLVRLAVFLSVFGDAKVFMQPDSGIYLTLSENLLQQGRLYPDSGGVASYLVRTPGYPLLMAFVLGISGGSMYALIILQILLDSLSCVLIAFLGERIRPGAGILSGVLAALNIGMITYAHFVLNDSFFVFIFLFSLLAGFKIFETGRRVWAAAWGFAIGLSVWVRPVVEYLPFFMVPFLFILLVVRYHASWLRAIGSVAVMVILFFACLSPWLIRNYVHHGRLQLSAQAGEHLLQYIVPSVWQYSKGIPLIEGMKRVNDEFQERALREGLDTANASPFEVSDFQTKMALEYLKSEPRLAVLKAWLYGAGKNLFAPAVVDLSYLFHVERPHYSYTEGTTTLARAWNFMRGMKGWFSWALVANLFVLLLARVIQAFGLIQMIRTRGWEGLFFVLLIGYFLGVSGPVGYAKYRLPFEPVLIVLLAIGLRDLYGRVRGQKSARPLAA